uniref:Uncharacterized protein n=1 Tax=Grammatophora oceanica TaxID=210454 RepID=A0A7S1YDC1_9STRA
MPPYFISGDGGSYAAGVLTTYEIGYVGTYTVEARPHDRNGRRLTAHTVTFTVVDTSTATGSGATTTATVPASTTPGEITGFKLWNTTDQAHPQFIKLLEQNENIDIQLYGSHFTVEAEVVGDVVKVNFGLDENTLYKEEYQAPFVLNGDAEYQFLATTPELSNIGLHTITATPFSSSSSQLTQASISFSIIDTSAGMLSVSSDEEEDGYVTGFLLWDTSVPTTPKFLKKIQHSDVVDIQQYGDQLSIEAEYTGHLSKIVFGLDGNDNYHVENYEPYLLGGDSDTTYYPTPELAIVGTHTITATPFDLSGVSLPTVSFSFLTVDGSTNAGSMAAPGTRQDLIEMLEDDLSFFLSGVVNAKYFLQSGHCLQWNLVYVKVEITEVSDTMCQAPERRRLRQSVASPAAS